PHLDATKGQAVVAAHRLGAHDTPGHISVRLSEPRVQVSLPYSISSVSLARCPSIWNWMLARCKSSSYCASGPEGGGVECEHAPRAWRQSVLGESDSTNRLNVALRPVQA